MKRREFIFTTLAIPVVAACSKDESGDGKKEEEFDVQFVLPASVNVDSSSRFITFEVIDGKAPLLTDTFVFEPTTGSSVTYPCSITESNSLSFTVQLTGSVTTGTYNIQIRRGTQRKSFGTMYLTITETVDGIVMNDNTTVYGFVTSTDGIPLSGVVISDGIKVVTTDKDGVYQLPSNKERGYVFISVPSGYEVESEGILPKLYYLLEGDRNSLERFDFVLTPKANQDNFTLFMLGDMHLARESNDLNQFTDFTNDLADYMAKHSGDAMYGIALGDMTWDVYWYSNLFEFPDYLEFVNPLISNLQIYHTMGNHDNDFRATNDSDAEIPYLQYIAPTYYSYNIGKFHFVVLDNIDCSNYDGSRSNTSYTVRFTDEQLDWLQKDLSYIDKSTPLIITTHAPLFLPQSSGGFSYSTQQSSADALLSIISGYTAHIVDGHTHLVYNVTPKDSVLSGTNIFEHNSGAICATWWRSGYRTPGIHVSRDGSPGGYGIWNITGTDIKWRYKATGFDEDYQFRTYDLNNVAFLTSDVNNSYVADDWVKYTDAYPANNNNEVLINIWNWNPDWTLKVTDDNGKTLTTTEVWAYDPLHIAAYTLKVFNLSTQTYAPADITRYCNHFFKVTADNANVNLTITVTDEFGNVSTEYMERPKVFSTDAYKAK